MIVVAAEINPAVKMLPPVTLPVALAVPPVAKLPPVIVAAAEINPPVRTLPPVTLPAALEVPPVAKLPPVIVVADVIVDVADINPPVNTLPPVTLPLALTTDPIKLLPIILPVALNSPVMYSPVVAKTATLPVPPIPMDTLPPELTTRTFDVPFCMEVASIPVS